MTNDRPVHCLLGREIERLSLPLRLSAGFWSRSVAGSGRVAPNSAGARRRHAARHRPSPRGRIAAVGLVGDHDDVACGFGREDRRGGASPAAAARVLSATTTSGESSTANRSSAASATATPTCCFCTDAAAEGLNFQFCSALVDYDMPWNPMRGEQRIGRINRVAKRHATILVVNLHYERTVETCNSGSDRSTFENRQHECRAKWRAHGHRHVAAFDTPGVFTTLLILFLGSCNRVLPTERIESVGRQ